VCKKTRQIIAVDKQRRYYPWWRSSVLTEHKPTNTTQDLHWKKEAVKKHAGGVDEHLSPIGEIP
jgi:hypothetical protein